MVQSKNKCFKIDSIVWKLVITTYRVFKLRSFKIDSIVWKSFK